MDTLCILVGPDERSLRRIQIVKMVSIYQGAMTSLVLDAELMATVPDIKLPSTEDREPRRLSLEARARIACGVWMRRSWTL